MKKIVDDVIKWFLKPLNQHTEHERVVIWTIAVLTILFIFRSCTG